MITHKLGTVKRRHEIKKVQEYVFESIKKLHLEY